MSTSPELLHLYISTGHNFVGHHGKEPGQSPITELPEIECVAGQGIRGDRYFGHKPDYKGQITFFASEHHHALCNQFQINTPPSAFRRNIITKHINLQDLIGKEFELDGIRFVGTESCKPCYWMDSAFHPGTEAALKDKGGLRAKILTTGILHTGTCSFTVF